MLRLFVAFTVAIAAYAALDCTGKKDGVHDWGCKAYTLCKNGIGTLVNCQGDTVYNSVKERCDDRANAGPPCDVWRNCTGKADDKYPVNGCTAFYTCRGGEFFGHQRCPGGLVYNSATELCDWKYNVPPPCGTKTS